MSEESSVDDEVPFKFTTNPSLISELILEILEDVQDTAFDFGRASAAIGTDSNSDSIPSLKALEEFEKTEAAFNKASEKMRVIVLELVESLQKIEE
jgi:hypothetical protein